MNWKEQVEEAAEKQVEIEGWGKYEGTSEQFAIKNAYIAGATGEKERVEIQAAALPNQQYGEWQLCPKCNGQGYNSGGLTTTSTFVVCDVCYGAKIITKPVIAAALPKLEEEKRDVGIHDTLK